MRHIIVGVPFFVLFVLSFIFGAFAFLYKFRKNDFFKGTRYLNSKFKFTNWFEWTKL